MKSTASWLSVYALMFLLNGCTFLARFNQPLSPQDQMTVDIWPVLNAVQKKEISELTSLEEVSAFIENFWKERDPTPNTEINEYRIEYEKRLAYIKDHYPYKRGWTHSDRARVYLIYGPPDDVYYDHWVKWGNPRGSDLLTVEMWVYNEFLPNTNPPTIFDSWDLSFYNPNLMKFVFADLSGCGRYSQVYSNVPGETVDPRVYSRSGNGFVN
jgi:GWxTD domain-containing protein